MNDVCSFGRFGLRRLQECSVYVQFYTNNMITGIDNNDVLTIIGCSEYPQSCVAASAYQRMAMQVKNNVSSSIS